MHYPSTFLDLMTQIINTKTLHTAVYIQATGHHYVSQFLIIEEKICKRQVNSEHSVMQQCGGAVRSSWVEHKRVTGWKRKTSQQKHGQTDKNCVKHNTF
jgi:hypothetical protein